MCVVSEFDRQTEKEKMTDRQTDLELQKKCTGLEIV